MRVRPLAIEEEAPCKKRRRVSTTSPTKVCAQAVCVCFVLFVCVCVCFFFTIFFDHVFFFCACARVCLFVQATLVFGGMQRQFLLICLVVLFCLRLLVCVCVFIYFFAYMFFFARVRVCVFLCRSLGFWRYAEAVCL